MGRGVPIGRGLRTEEEKRASMARNGSEAQSHGDGERRKSVERDGRHAREGQR